MLYYIGIGSNLGEREQTIRRAIALLDEHVGIRLGTAPLVYSAPQGFRSEHEFCNTVVLYQSSVCPEAVLSHAQAIEQQLGRVCNSVIQPDGTKLYSDRVIDIDLVVAYNDNGTEYQQQSATLTLPHPRMPEREFVLQPIRQLIAGIVAEGLPFVKMHGIGNDYIYLDCTTSLLPLAILPEIRYYAPMWCDRHRGIGGDGIVFITRDKDADLRMRIFNADGSEAEMCGNASRCIGYYAIANHMVEGNRLRLATQAGTRTIQVQDAEHVSVEMGTPEFTGTQHIGGRTYMTVDIGNPHAITLLQDAEALTTELVHTVGPQVECDPCFPHRTNVEFGVVIDRHHIAMRVWERGSGETQACGTGATATAYACVHQGYCDYPVTLILQGGNLTISAEGNNAIMTGPATIAFTGVTRMNKDN